MQCKKLSFFCFIFLAVAQLHAQQNTKLSEILQLAQQQNNLINQSKTALQASRYNLDAAKQSYLPKVDLLAGYNYLGKPLEINLQQVKNGVVEGSSQQTAAAVADIYQQITGAPLADEVREGIYETSKDIINAAYPNYNPALANQSYFTAGIGVRQPIYLGNKLTAARSAAASLVQTNEATLNFTNNSISFLTTIQYLRILYLNTIIQKQQNMVKALTNNKNYAAELVQQEILPPYQASWANVALITGESVKNNLLLDRQNAMVELNKLLNVPLDTAISITDTLRFTDFNPQPYNPDFYTSNPTYKLLQAKTGFAQTSEKISRSFNLPNIFAIGNYQLYQHNLPLTMPPWMVGVEMQWNIFDGTQTQKRIKASQELTKEAKMAEENNREELEVKLRTSLNKIQSLKNDVAALEAARKEAVRTTSLIQQRMENQLSSPKDVNEALLAQQEIEKLYSTSLLGYYIAIADYYLTLGIPESITTVIQ